MKRFFTLLVIFSSFSACTQKKETFDDYTASIRNFHYEMNKEFSDKRTSPLTEQGLKKFESLDFFPIDSLYRIVAKFQLEKDPKIFEMPTTTERKPLYKTFGKATFTLHGVELTLYIYQNQELILKPEYENHLFIPFMDKTNGIDSYGGGRYIDLEIPEGDMIVIDFNRAYNPYCAYNHKYSCPIPPKENHLPVEIKAGVKAYKK